MSVVLREMLKKKKMIQGNLKITFLQYLKWSKGYFVIFKFFVFAVFIVDKIVTGYLILHWFLVQPLNSPKLF